MSTINERIKYVREALRLSQVAFSKKMNINQAYLSRYENGIAKNIPDLFVENLYLKFNVNIHWLYTGEGNMFLHRSSGLDDSVLNDPVSNPFIPFFQQKQIKEAIKQIVGECSLSETREPDTKSEETSSDNGF